MKKHLLIVEDEAVLFRRLRNFLEEQNFEVDAYTPSVDKAIERIKNKRPDLVLLDINLQGEKTGIDLGKILERQYKIPFLYVTEHDDERTFTEAFNTKMEDFVVKTKPILNEKELLRKIMIILKRTQDKNTPEETGIMVLTDYLKNLKNGPAMKVSEIMIDYNNINFFTTDKNILPPNFQILPNYVWIIDNNEQVYMLPGSLSKIEKKLPYQFARINEAYIINILSPDFTGKINGRFLQFKDKTLKVTNTYKTRFTERIEYFYKNLKI